MQNKPPIAYGKSRVSFRGKGIAISSLMEKLKTFFGEHKLIVAMVFLSITVRALLVLNGGRALFDSGQDAPSYFDAAQDFNSYGWFSSDIRTLPLWPAGYPFFLSLFIGFSENLWWLLVVLFQHAFYILSVLYFYFSVRDLLPILPRRFLTGILLFMPTFLYSPSENMYESVLFSLLLVATCAAIMSVSNETLEVKPKLLIICVLFYGMAAFIQPKTAPIGLLALLIISFHLRKMSVALLGPLALWGACLLSIRSYIALGILNPSTNFGLAIINGGAKFQCRLQTNPLLNAAQSSASTDRQNTICAIRFFITHPFDFFAHIAKQAHYLYGPIDGGGIPRASTWFHGLGFIRIAEFLGISNKPLLLRLENIGAIILNIAIICGFVIALRRLDRVRIILISMPIIIVSLVHFISLGDSRYRLPVIAFQMFFLTVFLSYIIERFKQKK